MYKIKFHFYERKPKSSDPIGLPIYDYVFGNTLKELNYNWERYGYNFDLFKYTTRLFDEITEE